MFRIARIGSALQELARNMNTAEIPGLAAVLNRFTCAGDMRLALADCFVLLNLNRHF